MANINILDANDAVVATPVPPAFGPQDMANSRSVTLATDQTPVPIVNGYIGDLYQAVGDFNFSFPAVDDTGDYSILSLIKRGLQRWAALLDRIPTPSITGLFPVDTLATPLRMTPQTVTSASQSIALATTTRRVSVDATTATIVRINAAASLPANNTALADAIAIPAGATKDFDVPANTTLHFIRDGAIDGTIRVTELL